MARTDFSAHRSALARAADVVCDAWTPLLIAELLLGPARFDDLCGRLGISRNILTRRLRHLEARGVVTGGGRAPYRLTEAGEALLGPLAALMAWGEAHLPAPEGPSSLVLVDKKSGREIAASVVDRRTGDLVGGGRFALLRRD